jgi:hypothetical protein
MSLRCASQRDGPEAVDAAWRDVRQPPPSIADMSGCYVLLLRPQRKSLAYPPNFSARTSLWAGELLLPHWFHRTATRESNANQSSWIVRLVPKLRKGITMRIITASVIIAALSLGMTAFVQAQGASPQPRAQEPPAQSDTVIRSIQVVDVKQLQPAVRSKVDEIVAQTSEEDLQSLRKSIDAAPAAVSALKAKGLSSSQVVAINIADGVLTMFAKTA